MNSEAFAVNYLSVYYPSLNSLDKTILHILDAPVTKLYNKCLMEKRYEEKSNLEGIPPIQSTAYMAFFIVDRHGNDVFFRQYSTLEGTNDDQSKLALLKQYHDEILFPHQIEEVKPVMKIGGRYFVFIQRLNINCMCLILAI